MKVEILRTRELRPEAHSDRKTAHLPVIASFAAYVRTLAPVCLFPGSSGSDGLHEKLFSSLRRTLNDFPQLLATLEPCTIKSANSSGRILQRVRATWGADYAGGEFIEARTNARVQSLLPPVAPQHCSYFWSRSNESYKSLFPQSHPQNSALRVQSTIFRCGGFGIAIDADHALADAYTITLVLQYWSRNYTQMYAPDAIGFSQLPKIVACQEIHPSDNAQHARLLETAAKLPTRTPYHRCLNNHEPLSEYRPSSIRPNSGDSPILLHLAAADYERIVQSVRDADETHTITEKVAFMSFMWHALNTSRAKASLPPIDLHVNKSFRPTLGLPDGSIGYPIVIAMFQADSTGTQHCSNVAKTARTMSYTLADYDEDAIRAIAYDASLHDSPTSAARMPGAQEWMEFTLGMQSYGPLMFGPHAQLFCGPITIPLNNIFIMSEDFIEAQGETGRWQRSGVDISFCLPQDVLNALLSHPLLNCVESLSHT